MNDFVVILDKRLEEMLASPSSPKSNITGRGLPSISMVKMGIRKGVKVLIGMNSGCVW